MTRVIRFKKNIGCSDCCDYICENCLEECYYEGEPLYISDGGIVSNYSSQLNDGSIGYIGYIGYIGSHLETIDNIMFIDTHSIILTSYLIDLINIHKINDEYAY